MRYRNVLQKHVSSTTFPFSFISLSKPAVFRQTVAVFSFGWIPMSSGYCNQKIFALLVVAHKKIFRVTFRVRQHDIADFVHAENRLVPGDFVFNVFRVQKVVGFLFRHGLKSISGFLGICIFKTDSRKKILLLSI